VATALKEFAICHIQNCLQFDIAVNEVLTYFQRNNVYYIDKVLSIVLGSVGCNAAGPHSPLSMPLDTVQWVQV